MSVIWVCLVTLSLSAITHNSYYAQLLLLPTCELDAIKAALLFKILKRPQY